MSEVMWTFETERFKVEAIIEPDYFEDGMVDDDGETVANIESGLWQCFSVTVTVYFLNELRGWTEIGSDNLGGNIYEKPAEFFEGHHSPDVHNRNTLASKATGIVTCHYFPDMVREAIGEARAALIHMSNIKVRKALASA